MDKKDRYWKIVTAENRHEFIGKIEKIVDNNGGSIIDFNLFSDISISFNIEIKMKDVLSFYKELKKNTSISPIDTEILRSRNPKDIFIFINASFSGGKGSMSTCVPDVPG